MSGDQLFINHGEVERLGKSFESMAYDLEQYVKTFQSATDAETIHDGFGVLTESEEVTSAYIELSEHMVKSLGDLYRHLDKIGGGLTVNSHNSEASDDALSEMFGRESQ